MVIKIDKIPEGSKLEKYSQQLVDVVEKRDDEEFYSFIKLVFNDCVVFLKNELIGQPFPFVYLEYVPTHHNYNRIQKETGQYAIQEEIEINQSMAFRVGNRFQSKIFLDMEE